VNYEALEIVGVFIKFQNVKPPIENFLAMVLGQV